MFSVYLLIVWAAQIGTDGIFVIARKTHYRTLNFGRQCDGVSPYRWLLHATRVHLINSTHAIKNEKSLSGANKANLMGKAATVGVAKTVVEVHKPRVV